MEREAWWLRWGGPIGCLIMIASTALVLGLIVWAVAASRH